MKLTLLEMVQKVLSSLSSDEVSSIGETVESSQIVEIIEDVFYNMITNKVIPEHEALAKLEALTDPDRPNYLRLTDPTMRIAVIRYNVSETPNTDTKYREINHVSPATFLDRMMGLTATDSNVETITDFGGTRILCRNDIFPSMWTSFDDEYIVFDAYNSDYDNTMQASKSMVIAHKLPTFTKTNSFTPDIDDNLFPLLLNEAKSWAHLELKQNVHQKAEQAARSQRVGYQKFRDRTGEDDTRKDYGR